MLRCCTYVLQLVPIFFATDCMNMSFHSYQKVDILANILLTFQMEQSGTFLENSSYDYWILHKCLR